MIDRHEIIKNLSIDTKKGSWQSSFLDIIILLMSFFIIIIGVSKFDSFNLAVPQNQEVMVMESNDIDDAITIQQRSINSLYLELSFLLEDVIESEDLNIILSKNEVKLTLSNEFLYDIGSAELFPQGMEVLERIASRIALVEDENFFVDVEGHTDNRPVTSGRYGSNWDLSTARSSNVVEVLLENGFTPNRIRASGYADAQPMVPNVDSLGNPILENQAKNRRFEIRMYMN